MQAAIVTALGQAPVFGTFEEPQAQANEVPIDVLAAGIKQLDRATVAGTHYSSPKQLPIVPGTDGVGRTADGKRVYFASFRRPYGAMAERSVASWTVPVPEAVDDATAAALINPAFAAWLPLRWRADLQPGETVLIIGATGTSGKLAVAAARQAGAGRIVAAGRRLSVLEALGVDATVDLSLQGEALTQAFAAAAGPGGYQVIVDYIWGRRPKRCSRPSIITISRLTPADAAFAWSTSVRWPRRTSGCRRRCCAVISCRSSAAAPATSHRSRKCSATRPRFWRWRRPERSLSRRRNTRWRRSPRCGI